MAREVPDIDQAGETNRLLRSLSDQVAELSKWKASQEEAKKARIGKIFDEINEILKKNCCTHEEAISLMEMMKAQVTGQYIAELNAD